MSEWRNIIHAVDKLAEILPELELDGGEFSKREIQEMLDLFEQYARKMELEGMVYVISIGDEYRIVEKVLPGCDPCRGHNKYSLFAGPFETWFQAYDAIPRLGA